MYYRVKTVPVSVTDEEFEEIKKYAKKHNSSTMVKPKEVSDGTEWGLKLVNGIFWLLAIIGFIAVVSISYSVLSEPVSGAIETMWAELQMDTIIISISQLVAISVIAIGLCFMVKLLLKIIKNQNEIKSMMK